MTIFSRFKDIISSNINALLDKAEDPEKLLKLMIREMEDTLVEIKASCAGAMAARKQTERELAELNAQATCWAERAKFAVSKDREDLAREALAEKHAYTKRAESVTEEFTQHEDLVTQYQRDISELEAKLEQAQIKFRLLVERHIHANKQQQAQNNIRHSKSKEAMMKFEQFENRIDRMEANASLTNVKKTPTFEETLSEFQTNEELEKELTNLKESIKADSKK